jgi:subfamily B ATP-binding cassette protein MsbA
MPLGGAGLAMILDAALTVFRPWPLKVVIDRVLSPRPSRVPFLHAWLDHAPLSRLHILYGACAATLIIAVSAGILTYYYVRTLGDIGHRFAFVLRRNLFTHLQGLSLRFHDYQRTGDLFTRLSSDIDAIQEVIAVGIIIFGSNLFLLAGMLILMFWLNWQFALASLSVAPVLVWAVFRYSKARGSIPASLAPEIVASTRIVQGLTHEGQQGECLRAQSTASLQAYLEGIRYEAGIRPMVDVLAATGLATVMWYGATRVMAGVLTTGDVVVFFAYVTNLSSPMTQLARLPYMFSRASIGAEGIAEVMAVRSEVVDRPRARKVSRLNGSIVFLNVSFEYKPGQRVLSHINLAVVPGEKVAIVGAAGAGKSTLVSLIPRLYDPSAGVVCIDSEDVRNYSVQSLREQISLVLQDALLFSGTIRENIAFGRPGASEEEIVSAAVMANANEFIQRLPDGYDAVVAEQGTSLSAGEKQRIAIARAVLRDAPILILDEPTSSLDAASERLVMDALERAAEERTTLIIADRLTTVRLANRIVVLDQGRIVEEGAPKELLARQGRYAQLYHLQLSVEKDAVPNQRAVAEPS